MGGSVFAGCATDFGEGTGVAAFGGSGWMRLVEFNPGLDLFTVAKISGTSVLMIEKHYGHLNSEHARRALEKLALA